MFQDGSDRVPTDSPQTLSADTRQLADRKPTVGEHCEQSSPVEPTNDGGSPSLRAGAAVSSVPQPAGGTRGYNTPSEERATFPRGLLTAGKPVVALGATESAPAGNGREQGRTRGSGHLPTPSAGRVEFRRPTLRSHPFASKRFHVLLNSLFKVLFNFPSRYLSAIGLVSVFSLRWSLPPTLGCIPKQPDSGDDKRDDDRRQ